MCGAVRDDNCRISVSSNRLSSIQKEMISATLRHMPRCVQAHIRVRALPSTIRYASISVDVITTSSLYSENGIYLPPVPVLARIQPVFLGLLSLSFLVPLSSTDSTVEHSLAR